LLAKLGKKCCSDRHGVGKDSCRVAPSGKGLPWAPALRDLAIPKGLAQVTSTELIAPLSLLLLERPAAHGAHSLAGREPPDPPPRLS